MVPAIRTACNQFQKSCRNANRMRPGQRTVRTCSTSLMSATCSSSPKHQKKTGRPRPWQQNTMESVSTGRDTGSSKARPARLARLYRDYHYAAKTRTETVRVQSYHARAIYRHHSAGRSTRQHASVNGSFASQTGDETRLSRVSRQLSANAIRYLAVHCHARLPQFPDAILAEI